MNHTKYSNLKDLNFFSIEKEEKLKSELKFAIVLSLFYEEISYLFLNSVINEFKNLKVNINNITVYTVLGVFESIYTISKLIDKSEFHTILCLGSLIRGETKNFDYLSSEIIHAISKFNMEAKIPVIYGILTTDTINQAFMRAKGEKSRYFSKTALKMALFYKNL